MGRVGSSLFALACLCALAASIVRADLYLMNPRGSNDRNRETSTNRDNAQRLFNSQNNGKGGYCWGPPLRYYEGSIVTIEWTNQHGCGSAESNSNCELILQYMCSPDIRDGLVTTTIPEDATANDTEVVTDECWYENGNRQCTYDPNNWDESTMGPLPSLVQKTSTYGMHEPYSHWLACKTRQRNRNLFVADQNPGPNARNTRQNPGGTRHGYECAEERDYYPYWHPSPWRDVAVFTDQMEHCAMYQSESQNVRDKNYCSQMQFNNEVDCLAGGGQWLVAPSHGIAPPECLASQWSRDNHNGNGVGGQMQSYNWTVPFIASDNDYCVFRMRYNISSTDYDGWNTDKSSNPPPKSRSPVTNDPYIPFGTYGEGNIPPTTGNRSMEAANLSLAINTAQFARTFQDRTHHFQVMKRPDDIPSSANVYNINVRGKRGNIVQVYPAVEYDFVPNRLHVYNGDYVHFHWTGCDHNPQGNDGEGKQGTDRSNLVMLKSAGGNYPRDIDASDFFVDRSQTYYYAHVGQNMSNCLTLDELQTKHNNQNDIDNDDQNCMKLNPAGRDFFGSLMKIEARHVGNTYHYMSTRNNNFTNRSQKNLLIVGSNAAMPRWVVAIVAVLSIAAVVLVVVPFGILVPTILIVLGNALAQRI